MRLLKNLSRFYLTLAIPLLYLCVLYIIAVTPNSIPPNFILVQQFLNLYFVKIIVLAVSLLGLTLWIASFYSLRSAFGVLPKKPKKIVKSGPYKYLSHPMYVAIFLAFTGLALANLSLPGFAVNLLILTPVNWYRAKRERGLLQSR